MDRSKYSDDWEQISSAIRRGRAGNRCECCGDCGVDHVIEMDDLIADLNAIGESQFEIFGDELIEPEFRCWAINGREHPITGSRVVLTVAHLDHDPSNNDPANLRAFCQRCHNRYDAEFREINRQLTRRQRQIDAGQIVMFENLED